MIHLKIHHLKTVLLPLLISGIALITCPAVGLGEEKANTYGTAIFDGKRFSFSRDGLELIVELNFLPPREQSASIRPTEGVFRASIWMANTASQPIRIVTGKRGFKLTGKTLLFSYAPNTIKEFLVRETEGDLGLITLKPNEAAVIESESIAVNDVYSKDNVYKVTYLIDQKCKSMYEVWSGELTCLIDLPGVASDAKLRKPSDRVRSGN